MPPLNAVPAPAPVADARILAPELRVNLDLQREVKSGEVLVVTVVVDTAKPSGFAEIQYDPTRFALAEGPPGPGAVALVTHRDGGLRGELRLRALGAAGVTPLRLAVVRLTDQTGETQFVDEAALPPAVSVRVIR